MNAVPSKVCKLEWLMIGPGFGKHVICVNSGALHMQGCSCATCRFCVSTDCLHPISQPLTNLERAWNSIDASVDGHAAHVQNVC